MKRQYISLTDKCIGNWKVGKEFRKNGRIYYDCTCKCGTRKAVERASLLRGDSKSCGCMAREKISKSRSVDRTGERFGKITVGERLPNYKYGKTYYKCHCECGNQIIVSNDRLARGKLHSCGCDTTIPSRRKDYTGQRFGRLVVQKMLYRYGNSKRTYAQCICDCGNIVNINLQNLKKGATKSCGCLEKESRYQRSHYKDLIGKRFGILTVIEFLHINSNGHAVWNCLCDCGNSIKVTTGNLTREHVKSCGCNRYDIRSLDLSGQKYGKLTPLYVVKGNGNQPRKWLCRCDCGKETLVKTNDLTCGNTLSCGCMKESHMEYYISQLLDDIGIDYVKEYKFDECKNQRALPFDFYLPTYKTVIEYDGKQHYYPIDFFGGIEMFTQREKNDLIKNQFCLHNNIKMIRLPYTLTKEEIKEIIYSIKYPVTTTVS